MADLIVNAITTLASAGAVKVRAELTDFRGNPVSGFVDDDVIVFPSVTETNSLGTAILDLHANSDITPSGTFYTITVGTKSFLILKSGATQTLFEAITAVPADLGSLGEGLTVLIAENNLSDLENVAEARDNLELGNSATLDVGTTAGTVAAGDDPRLVTSNDHSLLINRNLTGQHPATSISFTPYLGIVATEVQTAIEEVYNVATLTLDEASEIAFTPSGTIAASNVQAAIQELDSETQPARDHLTDPVDAHDASAISFVPSSPFTAGTVQGAFDELFGLIAASPINRVGAGAGTDVATARVSGDSLPRFIINADGQLEWATGLLSPDTNLYRSAANVLKTDDSLAIAGNNLTSVASSGSVRLVNTASLQWRNAADTGNVIGVAVDSNDDTFLNCNTGDNVHLAIQGVPKVTLGASGLNVKAGSTRTLNISSDADNTAATAGIFFGSSGDTNLYRSAANTLKTDDAFISATSLAAPFFAGGTTPATSGEDRHSNDGKVTWRNASNAADIDALWVNASNNTILNAATGQNVAIAVNNAAQITFAANTITLTDGVNYVLGTTTGTKFGSSASAKLGLWGATPIAQPSSTGESAGYTSVGTSAGNGSFTTSTFTGNVGSKAYTISDIVKHLKNAGILAAS